MEQGKFEKREEGDEMNQKSRQAGKRSTGSPGGTTTFKELPFIEQEAPQDFYVDYAKINATVWTITLEIGVHENIQKTGDLGIRRLARVRMSPHHAKALALLLGESVQRYEAEFGELRLAGTMTFEETREPTP